ncbi:MAG: hypothetical protein EXS59_02180 [Candidatus Taylorbacteria bacterium]|nr:hypothetical protein [Candidatus Taylorbacteria bacterium]
MARFFWKSFLVRCGRCDHRNQPHRSPREGIRLALLDQLPPCKECGKELHLTDPGDRPLIHEVRAQLIREGLLLQLDLV